MLAVSHREFISLFNELADPRIEGQLTYPLEEILFLVISAVLSGAEGWRKIVRYGDTKLDLLRKFFPYENGIPSRYTLMTVFSLLDKKTLEHWLLSWTSGYLEDLKGELIAIDGKALKGASKGGKREGPQYLLNAFATGQGLVIGHKAIAAKTNEITAIPELLDKLNIKGSTISIDAIGCQKNIAEKIIEKDADYFLALKGNQGNLFNDVIDYFKNTLDTQKELSYHKTIDKGHGRVEVRRCWSSDDIDWLKKNNPGWKNIQTICIVESERHIKGKKVTQKRYYITSNASDAEKLLGFSRKHWAIENTLHWVLDVQLQEDAAQIRAVNAAENMGVVRKVILNILKIYKQKTKDSASVSTLRMAAAWDDKTAYNILKGLVL